MYTFFLVKAPEVVLFLLCQDCMKNYVLTRTKKKWNVNLIVLLRRKVTTLKMLEHNILCKELLLRDSKDCDIRTEWFKYGVNEELDEN